MHPGLLSLRILLALGVQDAVLCILDPIAPFMLETAPVMLEMAPGMLEMAPVMLETASCMPRSGDLRRIEVRMAILGSHIRHIRKPY